MIYFEEKFGNVLSFDQANRLLKMTLKVLAKYY